VAPTPKFTSPEVLASAIGLVAVNSAELSRQATFRVAWNAPDNGGKSVHGWAESFPKARLAIALAKAPASTPHRMIVGRTMRGGPVADGV